MPNPIILSLPQIGLMHDEIIEFARKDVPIILSLYKLKEALQSKYSVSDIYDKNVLDQKHLVPYNKETSDVAQDVSDLINFEIDEYSQNEMSGITDIDTLLNLEEDSIEDFNKEYTFHSELSNDELTRIGEELVRKKFISVESISNFVYAFSNQPIDAAKPIRWLKTYNINFPNSIALAVLIYHISPKESSKNFIEVHDKLCRIFTLSIPLSDNSRSFEASLKKVRDNAYKHTETIRELMHILNP